MIWQHQSYQLCACLFPRFSNWQRYGGSYKLSCLPCPSSSVARKNANAFPWCTFKIFRGLTYKRNPRHTTLYLHHVQCFNHRMPRYDKQNNQHLSDEIEKYLWVRYVFGEMSRYNTAIGRKARIIPPIGPDFCPGAVDLLPLHKTIQPNSANWLFSRYGYQ